MAYNYQLYAEKPRIERLVYAAQVMTAKVLALFIDSKQPIVVPDSE